MCAVLIQGKLPALIVTQDGTREPLEEETRAMMRVGPFESLLFSFLGCFYLPAAVQGGCGIVEEEVREDMVSLVTQLTKEDTTHMKLGQVVQE